MLKIHETFPLQRNLTVTKLSFENINCAFVIFRLSSSKSGFQSSWRPSVGSMPNIYVHDWPLARCLAARPVDWTEFMPQNMYLFTDANSTISHQCQETMKSVTVHQSYKVFAVLREDEVGAASQPPPQKLTPPRHVV